MARPLKKRRFGGIERNILQRFSALFRDPIPKQPQILREIVTALLVRIGKRNPREQRYLENHIRGISAIEREFSITPKMWTRADSRQRKKLTSLSERLLGSYYREALVTLRISPTPRYGHAPDTLKFQQAWLTKYLDKYPLKTPPGYQEVANWLSKHSECVHRELAALPCFCAYRSTLNDITDSQMIHCRGPAQLIDLLLAEIHTSSASAIRKVLSHRPPR